MKLFYLFYLNFIFSVLFFPSFTFSMKSNIRHKGKEVFRHIEQDQGLSKSVEQRDLDNGYTSEIEDSSEGDNGYISDTGDYSEGDDGSFSEDEEEISVGVQNLLIEEINPSIVANIPVYVSSDEETSDTDSESDDEHFVFSDGEFSSPPFYINNKKRGCVDRDSITAVESLSKSNEEDFGKVNSLCQKLECQGFADKESSLAKNLSVNFGLNRPRSLSNKKNHKLVRESEKSFNTTLNTKVFYSFWEFPWERRYKTMHRDCGNPPSYNEVKSYYRQLKKLNKSKAKEFRRNNENQDRRGMVPIRSIREEIKNHSFTRELVRMARKKNFKADVYLFVSDADTIDFNGCFSTFVQICKDYNVPPTVMTTGYKFASESNLDPMIVLASELDMSVREATAKYIPNGTYYPEPVLCIKVPAEFDTVPESFEVEKVRSIERNYQTPDESPIILKQVLANRENVSFVFVYKNPLITNSPGRAYKNKSGTLLQFNAKLNLESVKFENWTMHDITNITTNFAQSHASSRAWAKSLLRAFEVKKKGDQVNVILTDGRSFEIEESEKIGSLVRDMVISLLSRLFNSYDPISLAKGDKKRLCNLLCNYKDHVRPDEILKNMDKERMRCKNGWSIVDNISSRTELKKVFLSLLKNCDKELIDKIDNAAKNAGEAIRETLAKNLNFPEED